MTRGNASMQALNIKGWGNASKMNYMSFLKDFRLWILTRTDDLGFWYYARVGIIYLSAVEVFYYHGCRYILFLSLIYTPVNKFNVITWFHFVIKVCGARYKLAQEYGDLINLHDWYQSFKATILGSRSKTKRKGQSPASKKMKTALIEGDAMIQYPLLFLLFST